MENIRPNIEVTSSNFIMRLNIFMVYSEAPNAQPWGDSSELLAARPLIANYHLVQRATMPRAQGKPQGETHKQPGN